MIINLKIAITVVNNTNHEQLLWIRFKQMKLLQELQELWNLALVLFMNS
jgi:hypothetical protein